MAQTPQWIKKLGGHAGELFVCAELSKRGIPNALLPENFSDDDILIGDKAGSKTAFVQVKACHPERSRSFRLGVEHESWGVSGNALFCVFVWLGTTAKPFAAPRYWIAKKAEVGRACLDHAAHGTSNPERRFYADPKVGHVLLPETWEDRWELFEPYRPKSDTAFRT